MPEIAALSGYCTCEWVFYGWEPDAKVGEGCTPFQRTWDAFPPSFVSPLKTPAKETVIAATEPEYSAEQVGWRFTLGAVVLVGSYLAWPMIPVVMAMDLDPGFKAGLSGFLGATPFLSKFIAIAIMGRPAYYFLKRTVYLRLRRRFASSPAE